MAIQYNGIELEQPAGKVALSHSVALDMIRGESSTQNMDWLSALGDLPWGTLKDTCFEAYVAASTLFSLVNMDYQVCNGGISQYFFNGYHKERAPYSTHDVEAYDLETQKTAFMDLVKFAEALFPDRVDENAALKRAATAFRGLSYEEDAEVYETVYCDEDEYIFDEESGEEIENPDYFEPYDELTHENVIHGDNNFDDIFYDANEYLEELLELSAQHICKTLARDIDKYMSEAPEVGNVLKEHLPAAAFKKPSLATQIGSAASRAEAAVNSSPAREVEPDR